MRLNEIDPRLVPQPQDSETTQIINAANKIKKSCSSALAAYRQGAGIYRGMNGTQWTYIGNSMFAGPRKSANTYNYYTLIIDNSPAWKAYPKRSQSFICSSEIGYTHTYGRPYVVFPSDGTKIGICPTSDMWGGFRSSKDYFGGDPYFTLSDLTQTIRDLIYAAYIVGVYKTKGLDAAQDEYDPYRGEIGDKDLETFLSWLNKTQQTLVTYNIKSLSNLNALLGDICTRCQLSPSDRLTKLLLDSGIAQMPNGLWNYLEQGLEPKRNGFQVCNIKTYTQTKAQSAGSHEVWFSGDAVFVRSDHIDDVINFLFLNT